MTRWERFRAWLARLYFRVAFACDPDVLCDIGVEGNIQDGSRSLVIHRGSFILTIPLDNDDRYAIAGALTCPIDELRDDS